METTKTDSPAAAGGGAGAAPVDTGKSPGAPGWSRIAPLAIWLVPALVALAAGCWGITNANLTRDETATIDISTRSPVDIFRMVAHADAVHAIYYLIMHFWTSAFGISALAIRIPSLIGMVATAALVAVLGRMLASPRAGLFAGLLTATAPQMAFYAHDARSYAIDSTLVVLLVIVFVRALRSTRRRAWIGYSAMVTLTAVMHLFTALIVAANGVTVLVDARRERSWQPVRRWLSAVAAAAVVMAPFVLRAIRQGSTVSWIPALTWADVLGFATALSGGAALIVPFALLVALAFGRRGRPSVVSVALPWLVVPALFIFVGSIFHPLYVFRYLLYCLPALALLVAGGLDRLPRWAYTAALVALIVATIPQQQAVRSPDLGANDFRAAAVYLAAKEHPGDALVFSMPSQRELAASDRAVYARFTDIELARTAAQSATFSGINLSRGQILQRLRRVDRVWAISYWVSKPQRAMAAEERNQQYDLIETAGLRWISTERFRGGSILLFARPQPQLERRPHPGPVG